MNFRDIDVRDCQGSLWALFEHLEKNLFMSLEGDLSNLRLDSIPGVSYAVTSGLRRQTSEPELDFCVVPINSETLPLLKEQLSHSDVLGLNGQVIHVQIAQGDELVFIACDNFHSECSAVSKLISIAFLESLVQRGVLRSYDHS